MGATGGRSTGAPRRERRDDESGAILILALAFIIVVSVITTSLTSWVSSDLNNTSRFTSALSFESAANSVTDLALQSIRYNFPAGTLNASPPQPCWTPMTTPTQYTFNGQQVAVWCSTQWTPLSANTRVVTFSACPSSLSGTPSPSDLTAAATACAAKPVLQAEVSFDDYPNGFGSSNCVPVLSGSSGSTCGSGMTILNWAFGVVPPVVVNQVTVAKPGACTTEQASIDGSLLSGASVVNFVPTGNTAVVYTGGVIAVSDTNVSACAPSGMPSGNYYVSVVTPSGATPYEALSTASF